MLGERARDGSQPVKRATEVTESRLLVVPTGCNWFEVLTSRKLISESSSLRVGVLYLSVVRFADSLESATLSQR